MAHTRKATALRIETIAKRAIAKRQAGLRRFLKVKMITSFHGRPILVPKTMAIARAANILRIELKKETPIDTGRARSGWREQRLIRADWRIVNFVAYIRRLMLDGYSKQSAPGAVHRAIAKARGRMQGEVAAALGKKTRRKVTKKAKKKNA